METELKRIAELVKNKPEYKLQTLVHVLNKGNLKQSHSGMDSKKAVGVDKQTKVDYETNLEENLTNMVERMKSQSYKPQPVKRVYIPKAGSDKTRPLGIPAYWMMKFLQERIADVNFLRVINRFLKAGIMEEGKYFDSDKGVPQGGCISPILANVYLHYVLDLWFEKVVKHKSQGECSIVRFADDFVCCFQNKNGAENFVADLKERLGKFGLEIAEEKTKIIEFGRFAEDNRKRNGEGKPEKFDFLGFTHGCGKSSNGKFIVVRKTSQKKLKAKIVAVREWLWKNMHKPVKEIIDKLNQKLVGHYRYYGVNGNSKPMSKFRYYVIQRLRWTLNRRSQKRKYSWDEFTKRILEKMPIKVPKIYVNVYDGNVVTK